MITAEDTDKTIILTGDDGDPEVTQSLTFTITTLSGKGALYQTADGVTRGAQITTANTVVSDSLGRVILQVRIDGKSLTGHGASTDIVDAGARALVHALNKVDHADGLEAAALGSSYFWGV